MRNSRRKIVITGLQALAIVGAFGVGTLLMPSKAQAVTGSYDASKAVAYAIQYSCNGNTSCRNPSYKAETDDCTNFVSQALFAGGIKMDDTWNINGWTGQLSPAWGSATQLAYWINDNATWHYDADPSAAISPASVGSVIQYDWGGGDGWSHSALLTGTGAYANYKDPKYGYYKDIVKNNYGDRITQHTTDRDGSPWELGYWTNPASQRSSARVRYLFPFRK